MTSSDIVRYRLFNQQVTDQSLNTVGKLISYLGAIQAQEYTNAKWGLGLRLPNATDADIEQALADRSIVRTWALRGTLHMVAPEHIRWMLSLIAPRLLTTYAAYYRKLELDKATLTKCYKIIIKALGGGLQLTRPELATVLQQKGIVTHDLRMNFILVRAALEGVICQGIRRGKQFTFTLLDEWLPATQMKSRNEALAILALSYFSSRGPATIHDFAWWAGLTITDAKAGLEMVKSQLHHETINGVIYWMSQNISAPKPSNSVYLLPAFDEYLISYTDRTAMLDPKYNKPVFGAGNGIFNPIVVVNGHVMGTWKRTFQKDAIALETNMFTPVSDSKHKSIVAAARRFSKFAGLKVAIQ